MCGGPTALLQHTFLMTTDAYLDEYTITGHTIAPEEREEHDSFDFGKRNLSVLSYNIHNTEPPWGQRLDLMQALIVERDPDVITFQEVRCVLRCAR